MSRFRTSPDALTFRVSFLKHEAFSRRRTSKTRHAVVVFFFFPSQLDNVDEQAAQIRRELDGRLQLADKISRVRTVRTI